MISNQSDNITQELTVVSREYKKDKKKTEIGHKNQSTYLTYYIKY